MLLLLLPVRISLLPFFFIIQEWLFPAIPIYSTTGTLCPFPSLTLILFSSPAFGAQAYQEIYSKYRIPSSQAPSSFTCLPPSQHLCHFHSFPFPQEAHLPTVESFPPPSVPLFVFFSLFSGDSSHRIPPYLSYCSPFGVSPFLLCSVQRFSPAIVVHFLTRLTVVFFFLPPSSPPFPFFCRLAVFFFSPAIC